jgi:acetyl-CoA synthase
LHDKLVKRSEELGVPNFIDMIADETVTTDVMELMEWCTKNNHPALSMPPLL